MADGSALELAKDFDTGSRESWLSLVDKALKGGDFEKRLVSRTSDGLRIAPLYAPALGRTTVPRSAHGEPWAICQRVDHPDPKSANTQALADLEGGTNALALVFRNGRAARGFGLEGNTVAELDAALASVMLDIVAVRLEPAASPRCNATLFAELVEKRQLDPAKLTIDFGIDPIGVLADRGRLPAAWTEIGGNCSDAVKRLMTRGFRGSFLTADVRCVSEAGGSEGQELAVALATAVAYVRALEASGIGIDAAFAAISFTVAVDADQFIGMAKLRALRRLMARIATASGIEPSPIRIHAETAWRMMTRRDPWVNMLRTTMATTIAGLSGADTVTVLPHTLALGLPDSFARRVARNAQLVLLEESNLWRVADPALGSGAIEALTDQLCEKAWSLFQDIEREGGIVESLTAGAIQTRIAAVRETRLRDVATRRAPLTGTSEFPMLSEIPVSVVDVFSETAMSLAGANGSEPASFDRLVVTPRDGVTASSTLPPSKPTHVDPLPSMRLSEPFEALRDKSDAHLAQTGHRPHVFLASMGTVADHNQRSTWMQNLLAAGGIETKSGDGFSNPVDATSAFSASGASVACIASSDVVYNEHAESTAKALKANGATRILLAGRPGDNEGVWRAAGVDQFVYAGQDMVALLTELYDAVTVGKR